MSADCTVIRGKTWQVEALKGHAAAWGRQVDNPGAVSKTQANKRSAEWPSNQRWEAASCTWVLATPSRPEQFAVHEQANGQGTKSVVPDAIFSSVTPP